MDYIIGYKAYLKGLKNQFGNIYEVGKEYVLDSEIKWQKNGFHFSLKLEDVFRYYSGFDDIEVCLVAGYGNTSVYYDEFYDYEVYVSDHFKILKVLSREEIIAYAKKLSDEKLCRFISGIRLSEDEINYLTSDRPKSVTRYVDYYQYGDKDAFRR